MVTMKEFAGSKLTHRAFVQMNQEIRKLIIQATSTALKLEDELPAYSAAIDKMDKLVKHVLRYEETTEITGLINQLDKNEIFAVNGTRLDTTSTDEVRKQVTMAYHTIVARVNAGVQFLASDVIKEFITDANIVASHYQILSANQAKKNKKSELFVIDEQIKTKI